MKTIYRDVPILAQILCPECGQILTYADESETVSCERPGCPNYQKLFRVVNRPRVGLVSCALRDMI